MLEKQDNKKTEIQVEIRLGINHLNKIKEILGTLQETEKEYNVNCTQIQVNIEDLY